MTVYAISSASPFTKPNRQILNRAEIDVYDTIPEIDKTTYIFKELNEAKMARNVLLFNDINCSQVTEITPE